MSNVNNFQHSVTPPTSPRWHKHATVPEVVCKVYKSERKLPNLVHNSQIGATNAPPPSGSQGYSHFLRQIIFPSAIMLSLLTNVNGKMFLTCRIHWLLILFQLVPVKGSTLIREEDPGMAEIESNSQFNYNPNSMRGKSLSPFDGHWSCVTCKTTLIVCKRVISSHFH